MTRYIQEGDLVDVQITDKQTLCKGTVRYIPSSPGDVWIIETNDQFIAIQTFLYISKRK